MQQSCNLNFLERCAKARENFLPFIYIYEMLNHKLYVHWYYTRCKKTNPIHSYKSSERTHNTKPTRSTTLAALLNSSHCHLRLRLVVPLSDGSPIFLPHIHHNQKFLIHCPITMLCPALPEFLELDIWKPLSHISILEFVSISRGVAYPCLSLTLEEPPINIHKLFLGSRRQWSPISAVGAAVPASEHLLKTLLGG
jgi:hypothetical protein